MKLLKNKVNILTSSVLASTFFMIPLAQANTLINATLNTTQQTLGADNNTLEITPTGQVHTTNKNAVLINSANGSLIIDANNINGLNGQNAILTDGIVTKIAGVTFDTTGTQGTLHIHAKSGITNTNTVAGTDNIFVNHANATINNAGVIINDGPGSNSAIELSANAANTVINNNTGAVIETDLGVLGSTIQYNAGATGLILNNAGGIVSFEDNIATIFIDSAFTSIHNQAGGFIAQLGNAPGSVGAAIQINAGGGADNITNDFDGVISAIGDGFGIYISGASKGAILNAGLITTISDAAINLGANMDGNILNTGNIITFNPGVNATVYAEAAITLKGGLINQGNIVNQTPGGNALDFQTNGAFATFTQQSGNVVGNVLLANKDSGGAGNVFIMQGGLINGNVKAASVIANTLNLTGGNIAGTVTLGALGDTVNITGGSFNALVGGAGADIANILSTFTANGTINAVDTIHVQNAGTVFTLNQPITNMNGIGPANGTIIDPATTMILKANISGAGDVTNNGLLRVIGAPIINLSTGPGTVTNNSIVEIDSHSLLLVDSDIAGNFHNAPGSTLRIGIQGLNTASDTPSSGQLLVNSGPTFGPDLDAGSFIQPLFAGFLPQNAFFDIVTVNGGGDIANNSLTLAPPSVVVSFIPTLTSNTTTNNTILRLATERKAYTSLINNPYLQGVASTADILARGNGPSSTTLLYLLGQLDQSATVAELNAKLDSLTPIYNYGLAEGSYLGMKSVFETISTHLQDFHNPLPKRGMNSGDYYGGTHSAWIMGVGAYANQSTLDNVEGFKAKSAGIAIGADWNPNLCSTLGLALSYTKVDVDDKNGYTPKDVDIKSWQGTIYGSFTFTEAIYLDALVGIASNDYHTNRVLQFGPTNVPATTPIRAMKTASQADFDGTQIGVQADLGWNLMYDCNYYLIPFARLKYVHLELDDYTENGAGDLSLNVRNDDIDTFLGGLGLRFGSFTRYGNVEYEPEISALISYAFENNGEDTTSYFLGGGPAFATQGVTPRRPRLDIGLGLNALTSPCTVFTVKYNLEARQAFISNAAFVQFNYIWS